MTPRSTQRSDRGYLLTLLALLAILAAWSMGGSSKDRAEKSKSFSTVGSATTQQQPAPRPAPVIRLVATEEEATPLPGEVETAPATLVPQGLAATPLPAPAKIASEVTIADRPQPSPAAAAPRRTTDISLIPTSPTPVAAQPSQSAEKPAGGVLAIRFAPENVASPKEEPAAAQQNDRPAIPGESPCPLSGDIGFGRIDDSCEQCDDACLRERIRAFHDANHPKYYFERPFGTYVRDAMNQQISNGLADQMVLYHYDFRDGEHGTELSLRGKYQLTKFANRMFRCGFPIVIQETPANPALADARRQNVIDELKSLDPEFNLADSSVLVGRPRVPGLRGIEAQIIDDNNLQQIQSGGTIGPGEDADPANSSDSVPTIP